MRFTGAPICTTPCRTIRVARGSHTLIFKLERHGDAQVQVTIARRRETFRATLNPQSTISVSGNNESATGAAIRIDGVPVGNVPYSATVPPGRHMVQVGREGFVTFSQWVDLAPAQGLQLPVSLEREAPQTGSVLVAADVSGAEVRVDGDGQVRGTTPAFIENLSPGSHSIEVRAPNLPPKTETVNITTGQRAVLNVTLRPAAPTGEAKMTRAYALPAKFIIHTVGPIWRGGNRGENDLLASCYRNCFALALKTGARTIAFPAISTGAYRFLEALTMRLS